PVSLLLHERSQHVLQDSTIPVVRPLFGCVDARAGLERLHSATRRGRANGEGGMRPQRVVKAVDVIALESGEAERAARLAVHELQWQDAHADQVRAMDPFERFGDYGANAQQERSLR